MKIFKFYICTLILLATTANAVTVGWEEAYTLENGARVTRKINAPNTEIKLVYEGQIKTIKGALLFKAGSSIIGMIPREDGELNFIQTLSTFIKEVEKFSPIASTAIAELIDEEEPRDPPLEG